MVHFTYWQMFLKITVKVFDDVIVTNQISIFCLYMRAAPHQDGGNVSLGNKTVSLAKKGPTLRPNCKGSLPFMFRFGNCGNPRMLP